MACNISDAIVSTAPHVAKESGSVKLAFITRISEKKNLHFLLELLRGLRGQVQLNLFGPVAESDIAYWERCRALLAQFPANIRVEYHGSLDHSPYHRYYTTTISSSCRQGVRIFVMRRWNRL